MEFIDITDQHREVKKINQDVNTLSSLKENQQNKYSQKIHRTIFFYRFSFPGNLNFNY